MRDRPLELARLHLDHAIERNARLVVAIRSLAVEAHRHDPHHDVAGRWTSCAHVSCTRARHAIDGASYPRPATSRWPA